MGYENAAMINAAGYQVFGEDLPSGFETTTGYAHDTTTWPGSVWDFSGCPLAITQSGDTVSRYTGALITPRHLLVAHHATIASGTVYFVTPAGDVLTRTITTNSGLIGTDILILTLDSAATGCRVYAIPTSGSLSTLVGATIWCLKNARSIVTRTVSTQGSTITHAADTTSGSLVSGDSAQPAFTRRATELVLLGTHFTPTTFPSAGANLAAMQSFCDATSQTITTVSVDPATWVEPLAAINL